MRGIYRDGLSQTRRGVQQLAEEALDEGRALRGSHQVLPRKLRRELLRLERTLRAPIRCLDDAQRCERDAEAYRQALAAARTIVEASQARATVRRRHRLLRLSLALLLALPFALLLGARGVQLTTLCEHTLTPSSPNFAALFTQQARRCVQTDVAQCAELCRNIGQCGLSEGTCVAQQPRHCEQSEACHLLGHCTPHKGRCIAASDQDCEQSEACRNSGLCKLESTRPNPNAYALYGSCIATSDLDCAASEGCAREGLCAAINGRCDKRKKKSCEYTDACTEHGQCTNTFDNHCLATSDEDCRFSGGCLEEGRCVAQSGRCKALANWGCIGSLACQQEGRCIAMDGRCTLPKEGPPVIDAVSHSRR